MHITAQEDRVYGIELRQGSRFSTLRRTISVGEQSLSHGFLEGVGGYDGHFFCAHCQCSHLLTRGFLLSVYKSVLSRWDLCGLEGCDQA